MRLTNLEAGLNVLFAEYRYCVKLSEMQTNDTPERSLPVRTNVESNTRQESWLGKFTTPPSWTTALVSMLCAVAIAIVITYLAKPDYTGNDHIVKNQELVGEQLSIVKDVLLAVGGRGDRGGLAGVELLDPQSPIGWRRFKRMPTGSRSGFGAAVLDHRVVYICGGMDDASHRLTSCIAYDALATVWIESVHDMLESRVNFALAALDGSLYALGGSTDGKSMERYDVTGNKWTPLADVPLRIDHQSIATLNGYLYMVGGRDQEEVTIYASLYRFDPVTNSWDRRADMFRPRNAFSVVAVPPSGDKSDKGFLYAISGESRASSGGKTVDDTVERYDVATNTWETLKGIKLSQPRLLPGAVLLGGDIYIVGGQDDTRHALKTVEVLSASSDIRLKKSNHVMIEARYDHAVVKVQVEVTSESVKQDFEDLIRWTRANEASQLKHLADRLESIRLDQLDAFQLGVISREPILEKCEPCKSLIKRAVEQHDDRMETSGSEDRKNRNQRSVTSQDGGMHDVLLAIGGGNTHNGSLSSVELFDPQTPGWRYVEPMPTGHRSNFGTTVLNNMVYVCGGESSLQVYSRDSKPTIKSCIAYDPIYNYWDTSVAGMSEARSYFALTALDEEIYAVGGHKSKSVERYSVSLNTWTPLSDLPFETNPCRQVTSSVLSGQLYILCSFYEDGKPSLLRYDPLAESWTRLSDVPDRGDDLNVAFSLVGVPSSSLPAGYLYAIPKESNNLMYWYNVATDKWDSDGDDLTDKTNPHVVERKFFAVTLLGSDIYVVGGGSYDDLNNIEILSLNDTSSPPSSGAHWVESGHVMNEPRLNPGLVSVKIP